MRSALNRLRQNTVWHTHRLGITTMTDGIARYTCGQFRRGGSRLPRMVACYLVVSRLVSSVLTNVLVLVGILKLISASCSALATTLTAVVIRYTCRGEPNTTEKFYMLRKVAMVCSFAPIYGPSFSGLNLAGPRRMTTVIF